MYAERIVLPGRPAHVVHPTGAPVSGFGWNAGLSTRFPLSPARRRSSAPTALRLPVRTHVAALVSRASGCDETMNMARVHMTVSITRPEKCGPLRRRHV